MVRSGQRAGSAARPGIIMSASASRAMIEPRMILFIVYTGQVFTAEIQIVSFDCESFRSQAGRSPVQATISLSLQGSFSKEFHGSDHSREDILTDMRQEGQERRGGHGAG